MKRSSLEIKKAILEVLKDNKEHSYADLERKVGTNWESVRNQVKELEFFGSVNLLENKIKITEKGKELLRK